MPQQDKRLYPLTSYSIGIWRTPEKSRAYLLVLDRAEATSRGTKLKTEQKRFVVLVTPEAEARGCQSEPALSVNWVLGWMRQQVSLRLRHKNPFVDHTQDPHNKTSVLAFEVKWSNIVGLDFKWPLTEDPRLVLEAAVMSKRVFNSVEEVCLFYQAPPRASKGPPTLLESDGAGNKQPQPQQSGPPDVSGATGAGDKQPANKQHADVMAYELGQQHQHQQEGSMSRVSSWASWKSGGRLSLDQPSAAPAAAGPQSAGSSDVSAKTSAVHPGEQLPNEALQDKLFTGMQAASLQTHTPSFEQAWAGVAGCKPQPEHHGLGCSSSIMSCLTGSLSTAPTLSAGIAGMGSFTALQADRPGAAGATDSEAGSAAWEGFGERPPLQQLSGQAAALVHVKGLRVCTSRDSFEAASNLPGCSAAGSPVYLSPESKPSTGEVAAAATDTPTATSNCCSPSLPAPLVLHPSMQMLEVPAAGYATAPCSMPNSPQVRLRGRTGSGFFSAALGVEDSQQQREQLLQGVKQRVHDLCNQQQEWHTRQKSRHSPRSGSRHSSSRQRTQACPLCQQPLLQPLPELQERFHQQQAAKHKKSGSSGVSDARIACSIEQLRQQEQAIHGRSPHSSSNLSPKLDQLQQLCGYERTFIRKVTTAEANAHRQGLENKGLDESSSDAASPVIASSPVSSTTSATGGFLSGTVQVVGCWDKHHDVQAHVLQTPRSLNTAVAQVADAVTLPVATPKGGASIYAAAESASAESARQEAAAAGETAGSVHTQQQDGMQHAQSPVNGQQESVYRTRTVIITFKDPTLPHKLRNIVSRDVHLLKLYESGLPGWAIMLPSYGLYYRPALRRVTWLLFVLLSVVSMAMGFYDLYKNVPYFKQVMVAMFRPAAAVFEWLEGHTQIRLSILLTYMLGRTQLLVQLVKFLTHTSLQPLIGPVSIVLAPLTSAASAAAAMLASVSQPLVTAVKALAGPISMLAHLLWLLLQLLWQLLSLLLWSGPVQLLQAVAGGFMGLLQVLLLPLQVLLPTAASLRAGWSAAKGAGQVARTAVPVVKSSAAAASSSWPMLAWYPLEALELMRASTMRIMRALQAVLKFMVTLGSTVNQHRLSLMLQLRQHLRGGLRAAADSTAGRVASAVAVKMGQEQRVQRLHRRLHQTDSLVSMGSEMLGHADSVAVGTSFSIDGELSASMSMNGALGMYSIREGDNGMAAMASAGADSDDEVTSAPSHGIAAPPAELYHSGAGLRHRSSLGLRRARYHTGIATGNSGKQVSFARAENMGAAAAIAVPLGQLPAAALRKSVDAVMAGSPFAFRLPADAANGDRSRPGVGNSDLPLAAGMGSGDSAESLHQQQHRHAGSKASASSPARGWPQLLPSYDNSRPHSGGLHCSTAAAPVHTAALPGVAVNLYRRNSWG